MKPRSAKSRQTIGLIDRLGGNRGLLRLTAIVGLGLVCSYISFALAVSGVARQHSPQQALRFLPWEGIALAEKSDLLLMSGQKVPPAALRRDALMALRTAPLNPKAIRLLAISAGIRGDEPLANRLIGRAADLTRRDLLTQILLVESAARRDDLRGALVHFDIALRSSSKAPQVLFPRLAKAITNPEVRIALKPYMRSNSDWPISFLHYAKGNNADLAPLVDLVIETGGVPDKIAQQAFDSDLLSELSSKRNYADLKRFLIHLSGMKNGLLSSAALNTPEQSQQFGSAAWQPLDGAESGAILNGGKGERPLLSVYANSGTTSPVAQKLLFLLPGQYRFSFSMASIDRGQGGSISWHLRCLEPAALQPFWRMEMVDNNLGSLVDVSASCRVQQLQMLASGGSGKTGMEASISAVSLVRVNEIRRSPPSILDSKAVVVAATGPGT